MVSLKLATALITVGASNAAIRATENRRLSFESIAGYEPSTLVTDHNAIDLDQAAMEVQLSLGNFDAARALYTNGAHSKSIANVNLTTALTEPIAAETDVTGRNALSVQVTGHALEGYGVGTTEIQVRYTVISIQSSYVGCQVGANPEPYTDRCFANSGTFEIGNMNLPYTYNMLQDNINGRTLQGFSTQAQEQMYSCDNCPYATYEKFYDYYGQYDYANQWILAAFDGKGTTFNNGNADFTSFTTTGRAEAIKKGTAYMSAAMYVIRGLELAIDECEAGCTSDSCAEDSLHAWEQAVAFYTGSLEGTDGSGTGVLFYSLADKRCINFRTCGNLGNDISGTSKVNMEIIAQFIDGKRNINAKQCSDLRANKERIEELMFVPLIQGTLRYAYKRGVELDTSEQGEIEGATFAAGVLPMIHSCDPTAATTIHNSMQPGGSPNFAAVKSAFESTYSCLNIQCSDVGGIYDTVTGGYSEGAEPCGAAKSDDKDPDIGVIVGATVGGLAFILIVVLVVQRCGTNSKASAPNDLQFDTANPTVA